MPEVEFHSVKTEIGTIEIAFLDERTIYARTPRGQIVYVNRVPARFDFRFTVEDGRRLKEWQGSAYRADDGPWNNLSPAGYKRIREVVQDVLDEIIEASPDIFLLGARGRLERELEIVEEDIANAEKVLDELVRKRDDIRRRLED